MAVVAKVGWKVFAGVTGVAAGMTTRAALNAAWGSVRGGKPPKNPEQVSVTWPEAIAWSVASTAGMAVARLVATRWAAGAWERATGALPPGFEKAPEDS